MVNVSVESRSWQSSGIPIDVAGFFHRTQRAMSTLMFIGVRQGEPSVPHSRRRWPLEKS